MIQLRLYFVLFLFFLLTSCVQKRGGDTKVEYDIIDYSTNRSINSNVTIKIDISTPVFENSNENFINQSINNKINNYFGTGQFEFEDDKINTKQIDELVDKHLYLLKDDYSDSDLDSIEFYSNINIDINYHNKNLLVISEQTDNYLGGAHGIYSTEYSVFNLQNKMELELEDMFNIKELTELAYNYFLEQNGLTKKEIDIEQEGYWFKENKFHLNNNFTFDEQHLIFTFNPYEIASYAQGQIIINIPLSKLNTIITQEYNYIIN